MKASVYSAIQAEGDSPSKRKISRNTSFSTRTLSSCLHLVVIILFISKSSQAKDFYYHQDNIQHYSSSSANISGNNDPQHDSNTMIEFVSTSTTVSTRSNEVPIVSSASSEGGTIESTTDSIEATKKSLSVEPTSRPQEIATKEKQQQREKGELISHVHSLLD